MYDLLEESKKLIALRSDPQGGTRELVEYLAPFCREIGFQLTFQTSGNGDGSREVNLIAHTAPAGSKDLCPDGLLMATHLDTVPPGDHTLWTESGGDPFKAVIKGDQIYGLGSADTKLDFLCKLKAIENVVGAHRDAPLQKMFKIPIALVGTFGEERALAGARLLRESGIVHPRLALVGEPSELKPVIGHKGILYMKAVCNAGSVGATHRGRPDSGRHGGLPLQRRETFKGRAAHGSMPHLGESAIEKALRWLFEEVKRVPNLQLLKIEGGTVHNVVPDFCQVEVYQGESPCPRIAYLKNFFTLIESSQKWLATKRNEEFDPPLTTCNIGVIRSGADRLEIEFDFRLIPETDGNQLFELFKGLSGVEVIRSNPPMRTDKQSEIASRVERSLQDVGLPAEFQVKSGNTEGTIFNAMGAESIVIGPGRSVGNIHAPNEYNEIPQLKKAVEFYAAFLRQFC